MVTHVFHSSYSLDNDQTSITNHLITASAFSLAPGGRFYFYPWFCLTLFYMKLSFTMATVISRVLWVLKSGRGMCSKWTTTCYCNHNEANWSQVLSREWRCSWSSADKQCSDYIRMITNKVRDLTAVKCLLYFSSLSGMYDTEPKRSLKWYFNMSVRLQSLPWYKTGLVSRQVLHLLSKLQNWICPKTGQYETCLVSNTKIEASIWATKPKLWQSHLTSETVERFIQNEKTGLVLMQSRFWCGRLSVGTKPVLVQQV